MSPSAPCENSRPSVRSCHQRQVKLVRIIPVTNYPLKSSYRTFEAAIKGAKRNRFQPKARADSKILAGATVVDAYWTDVEFAIRFSNEKFLHILASPGESNGTSSMIHRWSTRPMFSESVLSRGSPLGGSHR